VGPVAAGSAYEVGTPGADAATPSISADGRYVAFTTTAPLDPVNDVQAGSKDVYVADMSSDPPAYELASALDGSTAGLTYGGPGGSEASGRVALSADGRRVAFFTTAASNLTGDPTAAEAPAGQIALRNLDSHRTFLVSAEREAETGAMTDRPVTGGALIEGNSLASLRGAALSADGTTIAWLSAHVPAQVPMSAEEAKAIDALDAGILPYDEPLWRRVGADPAPPTRRIVAGDGAADPFPQMKEKGEAPVNQTQGWLGAPNVDGVPQLSADGRLVALIGNPTDATNVFLVDMRDGLSRTAAVRQLTREAPISASEGSGGINSEKNVALDGHFFDLALSPDGRRIAFATARQRFPLAPPNLIGSLPSTVGLVELYLIDLEAETLERVTHGVGGLAEASLPGSPVNGNGATAPSFGGDLIAFDSTAANLVAGDGNEAGDAFTVEDAEAPRVAGATSISAAPPARKRHSRWRLRLSAFSLPDGSVRLVALVPAGGGLHAGVAGRPGAVRRTRRLAGAKAHARAGGPVALRLELPRRYRALVRSHEGVYANARVTFHRRGRRTLHGQVQVRFHAHRAKRRGGRR